MRSRRGLWLVLALVAACPVAAQTPAGVHVNLGGGDPSGYLRLLVLFASVSLAPALLAVLTAFLRISVVLFFLRAGLGSQQLLPNQLLIGLAILLTLLAMAGPLGEANRAGLQPLLAGKISPAAAGQAIEPLARAYFTAHTRPVDLAAMSRYSPAREGVPSFPALASAYVLSELRAAFIIGFVIFLPFLVIDLVVAGTLASLGLGGLPQPTLALPFKVLLFVMVDGWRLLADTLLGSLR